MADPRADNCKAFHLDGSGKVDGVELAYREIPSAMYELYNVRLITEAAAGGATVASFAVYDAHGFAVSENVYLAWAWPDLKDGKLLPGNQNNQHMIVNTYDPPALGPLAMFVGDDQGHIISDVIGGLGLPNHRHVSYQMAWRLRDTDHDVDPPPDPDTTPDASSIAAALLALNDTFREAYGLPAVAHQ